MTLKPALIVVAMLCSTLGAQEQQLEAQRMERLVGLGKAWGQIRLLHPAMVTQDIDWDKALVNAVAKIRAGSSREEYEAAVEGMLSAMHDPATMVVTRLPAPLVEFPDKPELTSWLDANTLLVQMNGLAGSVNTTGEMGRFTQALKSDMAAAQRVIFDFRVTKELSAKPDEVRRYAATRQSLILDSIMPLLIRELVNLPAFRIVSRFGHKGDLGVTYEEGLRLVSGQAVRPTTGSGSIQVGFLVNDLTPALQPMLALSQAGRALLVTEGDPTRDWAAMTNTMTLPEGLAIQFRVGDMLFADGSTRCVASLACAPSPNIGASNLGIQAIRRQWTEGQKPVAVSGSVISALFPRFQGDAPYEEMNLPPREYRVLAAIKFWVTINQFYPYKHLLDEPWDDRRLSGFIADMERAGDRLGYELATAAMLARIQDSHGAFTKAFGTLADARQEPDSFKNYLGAGGMPCMVQMLDGRAVIARLWAEPSLSHGLHLGDTILSVDGEDAAVRMKRLRPYVPASTSHRLDWLLANYLLRGPKGQKGMIQVKRASGGVETVPVIWGEAGLGYRAGGRLGPKAKLLKDGIAYVDLDGMAETDVDPALQSMAATRAVVLDMRGYPTPASFHALFRIMNPSRKFQGIEEVPLVQGGTDSEIPRTIRREKPLPDLGGAGYKGGVILLMDERSQSAAESVGLILEAGAKHTFVGSPTSGADGVITTVTLPGALRLYFTGMNYMHGDGRQLQRVGLQPDVLVRPTPTGLAEGRDEVLERAIRLIEEGK